MYCSFFVEIYLVRSSEPSKGSELSGILKAISFKYKSKN
jgi:hypothetical protein